MPCYSSCFPGRKDRAGLLGWALIALAVLDPAYHNRYVNPTAPASFYDKPSLPGDLVAPLAIYRDELYAPFLKETMGDNVRLLGFFRKSLYPFTAMGDGVRYVFNWDFYGTYSRRYLDLREAIKGASAGGSVQDLEIRRLRRAYRLRAAFLQGKCPTASDRRHRRLARADRRKERLSVRRLSGRQGGGEQRQARDLHRR